MAEGYEQPNEDFQEYPVRTPRTFQGRRVIKIEWEGQPVDAVDGLWVVGRKARGSEEIRIDVISTDEPVDFAHASKAAKRAGSGVRWIEPVLLDWVAAAPNDPRFSEQWGMSLAQMPATWDLQKGTIDQYNPGVVIGQIDTGVSPSHPDLQGLRRWTLFTRDAHGLYEKIGFKRSEYPERLMERFFPNIYAR